MFTSNPSSDTGFVLSDRFVKRLIDIRNHLDRWWETLDPEVRDYFIQHRDSEMDPHYKGAVMCAGDGKLDGLDVVARRRQPEERGIRTPIACACLRRTTSPPNDQVPDRFIADG